jgi:hypothetical protein
MGEIWKQVSAEHKRWLLINAVLIAAVVNGALSALIAWGTAASEDEIPLWAIPLVEGPSVIADTVGTFFILPFLTTLIITSVVWHELREGGLEPLHLERTPGSFLARLPERRARRGAYFGLLSVVIFAPVAVVIVIALDYGDISVGEFVLFKAIFGIVLGLVVTPPIAIAALADTDVASMARPGIEPGTP